MRQYKQPCIEHITDVGKNKAVGLLSFKEIRALGYAPGHIARQFNKRSGFLVIEVKENDVFWGRPTESKEETLAIAHLPSLQKWIDLNKETVAATGWPVDAGPFFRKSLETMVETYRSGDAEKCLMSMIIQTYNHPYHPGKKAAKPKRAKPL
jgi:hypothetical protein